MSDNVDLLKQIVTTVQKKNDKEQVNDTIKTKPAKVIGVDDETHKVFVYFLEDTEQKEYTFYNKSGEIISESDTVKVFYTTNVAKGWIGARMGEPNIKQFEKVGNGILPLSEYEYLTDLSVKYNGVTYTAEKDDTTGLISRIYDDSGNEFSPTINSGITDITMHNAAFLAVAMCSGFRKKTYGNTNIFELSNAVNGMWKNSGDGYDIVFSDKTEITSECVKVNDYIKIPITGDLYNYTSFIVVRKSENITDDDWHVALGQNPEFTPRIDICIRYKTWWIGGGTAGGGFASEVSANNDNYFVLAVRKTDMLGEFFINNNYIGKNNVFVTPINGHWFIDTGCFWFKYIATIPRAMTDAEITAKIAELMTTYGI